LSAIYQAPRISSTVLPRLAAISDGALQFCNALSVARTRLYGLGEHVGHADHFEYGAHRAAGNDAGTVGRGLHEHLGRSVAAFDGVMQRALLEADLDHLAAGFFHRLLHGDRNFLRLALADAHAAIAVADHRQRREAEDPSALHHLGDAVDPDHLFLQAVAAVVLLLISRIRTLLGHGFSLWLTLRTSDRPHGRLRPAP
jgi:hypothetical protein